MLRQKQIYNLNSFLRINGILVFQPITEIIHKIPHEMKLYENLNLCADLNSDGVIFNFTIVDQTYMSPVGFQDY